MEKKIGGTKSLVVKSVDANKIICSFDYSDLYLPFRKTILDFRDPKVYTQFIESVEKLVRTSKFYKAYLAYLHNDVGINACAFFSNIKDDDADIEFHHGPIFNLYNYCDIVTRKLLESDNNQGITTFDVAEEVLVLHHRNLVSLVPLSKSVHKTAHNTRKIDKKYTIFPHFIDIRSSFGNFFKFITEYRDTLNSIEINMIFQYYNEFKDRIIDGNDKDFYFDNFIRIFKGNRD